MSFISLSLLEGNIAKRVLDRLFSGSVQSLSGALAHCCPEVAIVTGRDSACYQDFCSDTLVAGPLPADVPGSSHRLVQPCTTSVQVTEFLAQLELAVSPPQASLLGFTTALYTLLKFPFLPLYV